MNIEQIKNEIYKAQPQTILYHYTSLGPLTKIIETKSLWATDINYFSDTSELMYFRDLCLARVREIKLNNPSNLIIEQLEDWMKQRFNWGHGIYILFVFLQKGIYLVNGEHIVRNLKELALDFPPQDL